MTSLGDIARRMAAACGGMGLRLRAGLPPGRNPRPGRGTLARILLAESVVP